MCWKECSNISFSFILGRNLWLIFSTLWDLYYWQDAECTSLQRLPKWNSINCWGEKCRALFSKVKSTMPDALFNSAHYSHNKSSHSWLQCSSITKLICAKEEVLWYLTLKKKKNKSPWHLSFSFADWFAHATHNMLGIRIL